MGFAIVVGTLIAAVLLAGFALPKHVLVGRRVIIDAPPELVWPDLGTLSTWPEWTEWNSRNDPEYDPRPEGTNKLVWTKSHGGAGTQVFTETDPAKGVKYRLEIMGGKYLVDGHVQLTRDGTRTAVAWVDSMSFAHSYLGRYFGATMDFMLGPMIAKSLLSLKQRSEERAKAKGVVAMPAPQAPEPALTPPPEEPKTGSALPDEKAAPPEPKAESPIHDEAKPVEPTPTPVEASPKPVEAAKPEEPTTPPEEPKPEEPKPPEAAP
jgi:hypothetical protein